MTRFLYSRLVNKSNPPVTLESLQPLSGQYSCRKDFRLHRWLAAATAVYLLDQLLLLRHPEWNAGVRAALTLAPLAPGLLYIRSWMRFIGSLDELQRRIQLEAWLFAAIGTALAGTAITALNASGVHLAALGGGLGVGGSYILAYVLWLVGTSLANRRFK
jgi:hypothetical protein